MSKTKKLRKMIFTAILFVFCMCMLTLPAYAKTYKIKTATDWRNISKKDGGTFKLYKNIKLSDKKYYLTINKNKKYTIDLNGYKVYTTYTGTQLRTVCPLVINKGTVVLQSSKKNKGVLYSTETSAVTVGGKSKFVMLSGAIVNDAVEFRTNTVNGICLAENSKCSLQNDCKIMSIGSGVIMMDNASLSLTGHPYIRAGVNNNTGHFTHYGSGIAIVSAKCSLSLKGGSIGTKATPDTITQGMMGSYIIYTGSGDYPILDKSGKVLKIPKGYKCVDAKANTLSVLPSNLSLMYPSMAYLGGESKLEVWNTDSAGYYTIYVLKK